MPVFSVPMISFDTFTLLTGLQHLDISNNKLTSLPTLIFNRLHSLEQLNLNDNQLRSLPTAIFAALMKLHRLHLKNNQLNKIQEGLFSSLISLKFLNLASNKLFFIGHWSFKRMSNLSRLNLEDNRMNCSCRFLDTLAARESGRTFADCLSYPPEKSSENALLSENSLPNKVLSLQWSPLQPLNTCGGVHMNTTSVQWRLCAVCSRQQKLCNSYYKNNRCTMIRLVHHSNQHWKDPIEQHDSRLWKKEVVKDVRKEKKGNMVLITICGVLVILIPLCVFCFCIFRQYPEVFYGCPCARPSVQD